VTRGRAWYSFETPPGTTPEIDHHGKPQPVRRFLVLVQRQQLVGQQLQLFKLEQLLLVQLV
jgi:hypothetical protein